MSTTKPSALMFGIVLATSVFSLQGRTNAQDLPAPGGDPKSEAAITKQLGEMDARVRREVEADSTTVLDRMRAAAAPKANPSTQPIEINNISGVPGDPKFEAQLTRMLEATSQQTAVDASNDPTIQK